MLYILDVMQVVNKHDLVVDLKDTHFNMPVFLSSWKLPLLEFRVLPCGLALAPKLFRKCVRVALEPLQY